EHTAQADVARVAVVRRARQAELDLHPPFVPSIRPAVLHREASSEPGCYVRNEVDVQHQRVMISEREPSRRDARHVPGAATHERRLATPSPPPRRARGAPRAAQIAGPGGAPLPVARVSPPPAATPGRGLKPPPPIPSGSRRAPASAASAQPCSARRGVEN